MHPKYTNQAKWGAIGGGGGGGGLHCCDDAFSYSIFLLLFHNPMEFMHCHGSSQGKHSVLSCLEVYFVEIGDYERASRYRSWEGSTTKNYAINWLETHESAL